MTAFSNLQSTVYNTLWWLFEAAAVLQIVDHMSDKITVHTYDLYASTYILTTIQTAIYVLLFTAE